MGDGKHLGIGVIKYIDNSQASHYIHKSHDEQESKKKALDMATNGFHQKGFSEETKAKLIIFIDYLKEWIPVFINNAYVKHINIFDFFAGPGTDSKENKGSPLLIIDEICNHPENKDKRVSLFFNEYNKSNFDKLQENILKVEHKLDPCKVNLSQLDFKDAFEEYYPIISNSNTASLLFLDQFGVKHITEDIFRQIIRCRATDFLFFISSSTITRFADDPSIYKYIKLSKDEISKKPYFHIHKRITEYYKSLIPKEMTYHLAPFSLKKGSNIYGIIFGSSHFYGMEKFLKTAWKSDPDRGEANYDIDQENLNSFQLNIFSGTTERPKKLELFEKNLKDKILKKELQTDKDLYIFGITNGFLPSHIRKVTNKLAREGKILNQKYVLNHKITKPDATLTKLVLL